MKTLGRIALGLLALILVLVLIAFALPREVHVARSVTIFAPPAVVFPHVNNLRAASEWSPWTDIDPQMEQVFTGPDYGVGARQEWSSEDDRVGSGSQEIVGSVADEYVESALDFGDMGRAVSRFHLAPVPEGTEVTWDFASDMGMNPVWRYMGLFLDDWVGADYEKGLARLKARVEGG